MAEDDLQAASDWLNNTHGIQLRDGKGHDALPAIAVRVREQGGVIPSDGFSVAVVDRTAIQRTIDLLTGAPAEGDPFVALADLASVVGAAVFDDRLIVLGEPAWTDQAAARANKLLGVKDAIHAVSFDSSPAADGQLDPLASLASLLLQGAVFELAGADAASAGWIDLLRGYWADVLPDVRFPDHTQGALWATSDQYRGNYDNYDVFNVHGDEWALSFERPQDLILDNDLRALFYLRVAQFLEVLFLRDGRGPVVHYTGGCLRTPLIRAQSELSADRLAGEDALPAAWLQQEWTELERLRSGAGPVRLPFWMTAVLASCDRGSDLPEVVGRFRRKAEPFRRRRAEISEAIRLEKRADLGRLVLALQGDISNLSAELRRKIELGKEVAGAGLQVFSSPLQPLLQAVPSGAVSRLVTKLARPELRLVLMLGKQAAEMGGAIKRMVDVFAMSPRAKHAGASDPMRFLEGLGRIAWVA